MLLCLRWHVLPRPCLESLDQFQHRRSIWGSNIYIPSQKRKTTSLIGGCYAEHVYIAQNADNVATYPLGFGISLALRFAGCVVLPVVYRFMVDRVNKQRDAMPKEEIMAKYTVEELAAMGDLSPLYRYER